MSRPQTTRADVHPAPAQPPAEQRAEEIVEQVSEQVTRFARRVFARAREEVEDIVAEAQSIRRGERR